MEYLKTCTRAKLGLSENDYKALKNVLTAAKYKNIVQEKSAELAPHIAQFVTYSICNNKSYELLEIKLGQQMCECRTRFYIYRRIVYAALLDNIEIYTDVERYKQNMRK